MSIGEEANQDATRQESNTWGTVFVIVIICALGSLFFTAMWADLASESSREIAPYQYQHVKDWQQRYEQGAVHTLISKSMQDGVISKSEYEEIEQRVDEINSQELK